MSGTEKTLLGLGVLLIGGFFVWQVVKPKVGTGVNPGRTNAPYSTATQPSNGGITSGLLSLGTGLAGAFAAYENNQTAQNTYE
jgi:hypothetical protein